MTSASADSPCAASDREPSLANNRPCRSLGCRIRFEVRLAEVPAGLHQLCTIVRPVGAGSAIWRPRREERGIDRIGGARVLRATALSSMTMSAGGRIDERLVLSRWPRKTRGSGTLPSRSIHRAGDEPHQRAGRGHLPARTQQVGLPAAPGRPCFSAWRFPAPCLRRRIARDRCHGPSSSPASASSPLRRLAGRSAVISSATISATSDGSPACPFPRGRPFSPTAGRWPMGPRALPAPPDHRALVYPRRQDLGRPSAGLSAPGPTRSRVLLDVGPALSAAPAVYALPARRDPSGPHHGKRSRGRTRFGGSHQFGASNGEPFRHRGAST